MNYENGFCTKEILCWCDLPGRMKRVGLFFIFLSIMVNLHSHSVGRYFITAILGSGFVCCHIEILTDQNKEIEEMKYTEKGST